MLGMISPSLSPFGTTAGCRPQRREARLLVFVAHFPSWRPSRQQLHDVIRAIGGSAVQRGQTRLVRGVHIGTPSSSARDARGERFSTSVKRPRPRLRRPSKQSGRSGLGLGLAPRRRSASRRLKRCREQAVAPMGSSLLRPPSATRFRIGIFGSALCAAALRRPWRSAEQVLDVMAIEPGRRGDPSHEGK